MTPLPETPEALARGCAGCKLIGEDAEHGPWSVRSNCPLHGLANLGWMAERSRKARSRNRRQRSLVSNDVQRRTRK